MLFEEIYEEFKKYAQKRHKKESFNSTTYIFKARILLYFKEKKLCDLTKKDIIEWQNKIYNLHFSNNYNRLLYFSFCEFLDYCIEFYNFPCNYLKEIGQFKKRYEEKKTDFYTLKEFKHFIKYVDDIIYKRFFELMFFTGTRPGEAMALQFKDLQGEYLLVTKTITSHCGREFDTPKTASSVRKIRIDQKLKSDLISLQKKYIDCDDDYFIFGGVKPLAPTTINRKKKIACKKANIRPITLHQFRHSHATLLVNKGILINEVSRRLGHSDVSTTLNIYTHTDLTHEKRVLKTLNSMRCNFFNSTTYIFKNLISILKRCYGFYE